MTLAIVAFLRQPEIAAAAPEAEAPSTRPRSATSELTALSGLGAGILAMLLLRGAAFALPMKALGVVAATAAPMIIVALHRRREEPSAAPLNLVNPNRLVRKLVGFAATLGALFGIYWLLPEYAGSFYAPVWAAAHALAPWLAIATPIYIVYTDRRQSDPEDAYAQLGALLMAQGPLPDWSTLAQHARGWIVKGFFLPLMFVYLVGDLDLFWRTDFASVFSSFSGFYDFAYNASYLVDLLFAVVGYSLTLRLLDSHIRSAEPALSGWVICIICYQPFWSVFGPYLAYESDKFYWGDMTAGHPVLYALWGSAILCCLVIYTLSTVSFGLRFSNLTHRGIITSGPYRWTKHPAYIAKCLSFWLISVPFLSNQGPKAAITQSLLLVLANAIYVARAITEERHLARDPLYKDYQDYIRRHGLFARILRLPGLRQLRRSEFGALWFADASGKPASPSVP